MHEHFDISKPNDIATLIYLNNDYSGGEIYFPEYDISHKPEPGDLLCFPDNPDYVHGVSSISNGVRYTIPRWFTRIV
jgi:predicted 2-oxoglutarate/Fe(II)-dependent dioxygenase YbiX